MIGFESRDWHSPSTIDLSRARVQVQSPLQNRPMIGFEESFAPVTLGHGVQVQSPQQGEGTGTKPLGRKVERFEAVEEEKAHTNVFSDKNNFACFNLRKLPNQTSFLLGSKD